MYLFTKLRIVYLKNIYKTYTVEGWRRYKNRGTDLAGKWKKCTKQHPADKMNVQVRYERKKKNKKTKKKTKQWFEDKIGFKAILICNRVCSHDVMATMLEESTRKRQPCLRSEIFFWGLNSTITQIPPFNCFIMQIWILVTWANTPYQWMHFFLP